MSDAAIAPPIAVGRSAIAAARNGVIAVVVVVLASGISAVGIHRLVSHACDDAKARIVTAENHYRGLTGAYTDVAGLHYAGYLPHSDWTLATARITGAPGAGTSYSVVPQDFC